MNKTYRLIWSDITQAWVATSETAKGRGKRAAGVVLLAAAAVAAGLPEIGAAQTALPPSTLPTGGQVVAGQASIGQNATTLNVNQTSQRAAIDWQTFNVGSAASVNFNQPSSSAVTLNRVLSSNPSQIFGQINANGQVFLTNPAGIYFAPGASANVGGLVATTHGISNSDFMAGSNRFTRDGATGSVINEGQLGAGLGGYIALLAPEVRNTGVVIAQMGTVALAAGEAYELQFTNGSLANIQVEPATLAALVDNRHAVQAPDGFIILSAQAADHLQGGVVRNSGSLEANGLVNDGGTIRLLASDRVVHSGGISVDAARGSGGNGGTAMLISDLGNPDSQTVVSGSINARGGELGGNGGFIETSGHWLNVSGSRINASASRGQSGLWLLDPYDVTIGSSASGTTYASSFVPGADSTILASDIATTLQGGTSVTITTGTSGGSNGDITVASAITKASGNTDVTLTLQAANSIVVDQAISNTGGSGKLNVVLDADNDNGTRDGNGIIMLNNSISTGGGNLSFGTGASMSIGGVTTEVGGDVYVGGSSAIDLTTGGGNVTVNGEMLIANTNGLHITSGGGNVNFGGILNSGNSYAYNSTAGQWNAALIATKSGTGAGVGDAYLATITSRLENAVVSRTANYQSSWLGGYRGTTDGTTRALDANWRWVSGPEGLTNSGAGTVFFTQIYSASGGGNGTRVGYTNWTSGEPNNCTGFICNSSNYQLAIGEPALQFTGSSGLWNDFPDGVGRSLSGIGSNVETNLAASPLNVNAGSGTVTFSGAVGSLKALASVNVTAATIAINGGAVTTTGAGTGSQTYSGNITLGSASTVLNMLDTATAFTLASNKSITNASGVDASLTIKTTANILLDSGSNISSVGSGKKLNTVLWSDSDANGGAITLTSSTITTNGGHLWIGGGSGSTTWNGLTVGDGSAVNPSAAGNGITLTSSTVSSGIGSIYMNGKGTNTTTLHSDGIDINSNTTSIQSTTGSITLIGTGGTNTGSNSNNDGIRVSGSIQSTTGAISLTGYGSAGPLSEAIAVEQASISSDSGNIALNSDIFWMSVANASVASSGALTIAPTTVGQIIDIGGGTGGLSLDSAYFNTTTKGFVNGFSSITVGSATAGNITVGTTALTYSDPLTLKTAGNIAVSAGARLTGAAGQNASLVLWSDADASGDGNISLPGTGAGAITIDTNGGHLWMGGSATNGGASSWNGLTVGNGYATGTAVQSIGVFLHGTTITSDNGNVAIYGDSTVQAKAGGDAANHTEGIRFGGTNPVNINSGTGTILMDGIARGTTGWGIGIEFDNSGGASHSITSAATAGNAIALTGDASSESAGANSTTGLWLHGDTALTATGSGGISLTGVGGAHATYNEAIWAADGASAINAGTGALTVLGRGTVNLSSSAITAGTASMTAENVAQTTRYDVIATNALNNFTGAVSLISGNNLSLKDANDLTIGTSNISGNLIAEALGGDLTIGGNLSKTSGADATANFKASGSIFQNASTTVSSTSNKLNSVFWADTDANGGYIQVNTGSSIATNGGHLWMGGGTQLGSAWNGLTVGDGAAQGDATLSSGISILSTTLSTSGGNLYMKGVSRADAAAGAAWGHGVVIDSSSSNSSVSTGAGNIEIIGIGQGTTGDSNGVEIGRGGWGSTTLQATNGNIAITGNGSSTGARSVIGVSMPGNGQLLATGSGSITINGTGGTTSGYSGSSGISIYSGKVLAASGAINLNGFMGAGNFAATLRQGIYLNNSSIGQAAGSAVTSSSSAITLTGDSVLAATFTTLSSDPGNMTAYRNNVGEIYSVPITGSATGSTVWGTGPFTDDSLLAKAAVFDGSLANGASATLYVQMMGSQNSYASGTANGVTTVSYPAWPGSYDFVSPPQPTSISSTGNLVIQSPGAAFNKAISTNGIAFGTGLSSLTIGRSTNTAIVTIAGQSSSINGPITVTGGSVEIQSNISAAAAIDIAALTGNLTLAGAVGTSDTTANAIKLNAGKNTSAGTTSGGNIIVNGGSVAVGTGGFATLYSGSVSGSTGLTTLVGSSGGRFRYNSDEATSNFSTALTAGTNAVYREQRTLSLTPGTASSTYGDAVGLAGMTGSVSGYVNGDDAANAGLSGTAAFNTTATSTSSVGIYNISYASGLLNGVGYAIADASGSTGEYSVTPRPISIAANTGQAKVYGDVDPTLTFTAEANGSGRGLVGSDSFSGSLARAAGENVANTYAINQGSLANGNYAISYAAANFAVTPANLTVTADAKSKTYGDADPALTFVASGFKLSDTISIIGGAISRVAGENVATYAIGQNTLTAGGNYTISYTGANVAITPRPINITANTGQAKVYGDVDPTLTFTAEANGSGRGLVGSDSFSGSLARAAGENVANTYAINQGSLANGNYAISYAAANFAVTPANLTVTADAKSKTYGDADPALTFVASGFKLSDTISIIGGAISRVAGENVATYAIGQNTLTAGGNYTISYTGANLTISPATLSVNANNASKTYDGLAYWGGNGVAYSGFVNSETSAVLSGTLTYGGSSQGAKSAGSYAIVPSGLTSANYAISYADGTLKIDAITTSPDLPPVRTAAPLPTPNTNPAPLALATGSLVVATEVIGGNISVALQNEASVQIPGLVTVAVPKNMAAVGSSFTFKLPEQVLKESRPTAVVLVTLPNGNPLPSWLGFQLQSQLFVATSVPASGLPLQVMLTIDGIKTFVLISEDAD
jgi:filamentous hemagglutinin family protein